MDLRYFRKKGHDARYLAPLFLQAVDQAVDCIRTSVCFLPSALALSFQPLSAQADPDNAVVMTLRHRWTTFRPQGGPEKTTKKSWIPIRVELLLNILLKATGFSLKMISGKSSRRQSIKMAGRPIVAAEKIQQASEPLCHVVKACHEWVIFTHPRHVRVGIRPLTYGLDYVTSMLLYACFYGLDYVVLLWSGLCVCLCLLL
jgi:hypothetical protein